MKAKISLTILFLLFSLSAQAAVIKEVPELTIYVNQGPSLWDKIVYCKWDIRCYFQKNFGASLTTIQATDRISDSRTTINTNFSNLNSSKIETSATSTEPSMAAWFIATSSTHSIFTGGFISQASSTFSAALNAGTITSTCSACITDANVVNALTISAGTINDSAIGATTPSTGAFTTLSHTGLLSSFGNITASSTINFGDGTLEIPNAASSTITTLGNIYIDSTSGQLKFFDGNNIQIPIATSSISFTLASSTLNAYGGLGTTSTSTIIKAGPPQQIVVTEIFCKSDHYSQTVQNAFLQVGDGTNFMTLSFCSENGDTIFPTSNNTFTKRELMQFRIGTASGTVPDFLTIDATYKILGD